jgi:probable rRNA maturation factor
MDGRVQVSPPIAVFKRRPSTAGTVSPGRSDGRVQAITGGESLVIIHKAAEGVSSAMLARFLNRGRRELKLDGEVTLLVASSAQLRRLNRDFRGQDYATDVLSFPSETVPQPRQKRRLPPGHAGYAGDIAISADIARQNGRRLGHGTAIEIKTLILHGLLHLAGYDHERDNGRMARRELRLRSALGLAEGLIERASLQRAQGKPAPPVSAIRTAERGKRAPAGRRGKER